MYEDINDVVLKNIVDDYLEGKYSDIQFLLLVIETIDNKRKRDNYKNYV